MDAIKAISPLIDTGEIEEAMEALTVALGTLVVTNQVVSFPVLRARAALDEAESLIGGESPSDEDKQRVDDLVCLHLDTSGSSHTRNTRRKAT